MEKKKIKVPTAKDIEGAGKGILMTTVSLGVVAGGIWGIRKLNQIKKERERKNNALEDILTVGTPEYYANVIYIAVNGWGTDEDAIYQAFEDMPTKTFFGQVIRAYRDLTGNSLNEDLNDDLSSSELAKVTEILNSKPA